ncbi:MAG: hypothetical protein HY292_15085 [Planctomycetes bacterium]|nr:hypothetical protein [Planctomycetota bacterium]
MAVPWIHETTSRIVTAALPATSGATTISVFLAALGLGVALRGGPSARRALGELALLTAAVLIVGSRLVDGIGRLPIASDLARAISLLFLVAVPACLLGRALRGIQRAMSGVVALVAAVGAFFGGGILATIGPVALLALEVLALTLVAWLMPREDETPAAPSLADGVLLAAGVAGGFVAASFVNRLRDVGVGAPGAAAVAASLLVAVGAGALIGGGLGRVRASRAIAILAALLVLAAALHWELLGIVEGPALRSAVFRLSPRTPRDLELGAAFTFAPIAASWGVLAGALLTVAARSRAFAGPSCGALAMGVAAGIVVVPAPVTPPIEPARIARALDLPQALAGGRATPDVVVASAKDREDFLRRRAPARLAVLLPTVDREALTHDAFRAARRSVESSGVFCQWVRLAGLDARSGEMESVIAAFFAAFPYGSLWLSGFGEKDPWIALVGTANTLSLDADSPRASSPLARYIGDLTDYRDVHETAMPEWAICVSPAAREAGAGASLQFLVDRRGRIASLARQGATPAIAALQAASGALLRAEVARLRAEREPEARFAPAEAAARRDAEWDSYADAMRALPGDPGVEDLVCAASRALDAGERALRLQRLVETTGVATGSVVRALEDAKRATEKR